VWRRAWSVRRTVRLPRPASLNHIYNMKSGTRNDPASQDDYRDKDSDYSDR